MDKRIKRLEERTAPAVVLCAEYFAAYPFTEEDKARARAKVRDLEMKMMGYDPLHQPEASNAAT